MSYLLWFAGLSLLSCGYVTLIGYCLTREHDRQRVHSVRWRLPPGAGGLAYRR